MNKMRMESLNMTTENIDKIGNLFPECITEIVDNNGNPKKAINFEMLRQMISYDIIEGDEAYELSWVGKKQAIVDANKPIRKTLRPCIDRSVNWNDTENLYIEGDNLDVLKLLQESYLGKVKLIYIDPPYNTGKNYIYRNDFSVSTDEFAEQAGYIDEEGARLVANPVGSARFHSTWLSMMYQRLMIARNLLANDGILVCAIDENEFTNLASIMKEIFCESGYEHRYVSVVHNPRGQQGKNFSYVNEYLIFIYPADGEKYIADFPKDKVDHRNLRDSGTESDRTDARECFYPFYVKNGEIIRIGEVPDSEFHPAASNIKCKDGTIEVWPITDDGYEKKWRYARSSVEGILEKLELKIGRNSLQIYFNKDEEAMRSVWANARYDSSEYGTKLLDKLLGGCSFTFPKSLYAVYDCVRAATRNDKDAIVLDFFSGSATTAHAVMKLNAEDNGHRKFIMVQLPENLDEALVRSGTDKKTKSSIRKAIKMLDKLGYEHTICSIGEERIRRAGDEIKSENPDISYEFDAGFRVFRLDDSNMNDVYFSPNEYSQDMLNILESNVKSDRNDLDLLFGCLLEWGLPLSLPYSSEYIDGCTVHNYNDGDLIACFDENVPESVIINIANKKPLRAVFRDTSFKNSPSKINVEEIFKLKSPNTRIKVI